MRRFGLPIALFLIAIALLGGRLWDVQVGEHTTWAREAANLVRSHHVEPYVRGTIRDREGRPIVRDEEVYELEFVWREFRRGHPLGQVTMARSLLFGRPVRIDAARSDLARYALELVSLTPDDVEAFARGDSVRLGNFALPNAVDEARGLRGITGLEPQEARIEQRRESRAGDLRFYVQKLLGLTAREERRLREAVEEGTGTEESYLALASRVTGVASSEVADSIRQRTQDALEQLVRLGAEIDWPTGTLEKPWSPEGITAKEWRAVPTDERLFALVELRRSAVEDETADALFELAVGFPPWRLDAYNLSQLDLGWLDRLVGWDTERRTAWVQRRGDAWPEMAAGWVAAHAIARAKLYFDRSVGVLGIDDSEAEERRSVVAAEALLSAVAHVFRAGAARHAARDPVPTSWREVDALEGFDVVEATLVDGSRLGAQELEAVFPFQLIEARESESRGEALLLEVLGPAFDSVAAALDEGPQQEYAKRLARLRPTQAPPRAPEPHTRSEAARHLIELVKERRSDWNPGDEAAVGQLLVALEVHAQTHWGRVLETLRADGGGVAVEPAAIGRAIETRRYVVRDRGSRPRVVGGEPRYDLVHLVTRHPRQFAGFRVRATTVRVRPRPEPGEVDLNRHEPAFGTSAKSGEGVEVARHLLGKVRHPYLVDLLRQRADEVELAEMQRKLDLPEDDRAQILGLVSEAWQPQERMGGSGIEGWFDPELRGEEGYLEVQGLQDRRRGNREPIYKPAIDGQDVYLTLDLELQRAAERFLVEPPLPPGPQTAADKETDFSWYQNPVGAIVLATVDGEVLVAASTPLVDGLGRPRFTDGERNRSIDRTLRRPRFSPPGSVVKPLLASYAMQELGLKFETPLVYCDPARERLGESLKPSSMPGWGMINCNTQYGHSRRVSPEWQSRIGLRDALKHSCNTYFACLGETYYTGPSIAAAYAAFGLGEPTGVRWGNRKEGRSGLVDSWHFNPSSPLEADDGPTSKTQRQYLGNGLAHIDVNVLQMARAYAGLATGQLPKMRLVRRIGDEQVQPVLDSVQIEERHLARVREALRAVVAESKLSGSRYKLSKEALGFELCAKTGSADYRPLYPNQIPGYDEQDEDKLSRKHAWFAGWFPRESPRFVCVVYAHDTSVTASYIATFLMGDFLTLPEVRAFLQKEGL